VRDPKRQKQLRSFLDLCETVGFPVEPFQAKIAGALLGPEREKLITLPRKNGKSRLVGTFAAWSLSALPAIALVPPLPTVLIAVAYGIYQAGIAFGNNMFETTLQREVPRDLLDVVLGMLHGGHPRQGSRM